MAKTEEYLQAATESLQAGRLIAATSLAIHAAINASDALTGLRLGKRAAGLDHDQALTLLGQAGADGADAGKALARLLPLKAKAEYDPDEIPRAVAEKAVSPSCPMAARMASHTSLFPMRSD